MRRPPLPQEELDLNAAHRGRVEIVRAKPSAQSDPLRVQMSGPLWVFAAGFGTSCWGGGIGPGPWPSSCS
jgi:hypothetical protein